MMTPRGVICDDNKVVKQPIMPVFTEINVLVIEVGGIRTNITSITTTSDKYIIAPQIQ